MFAVSSFFRELVPVGTVFFRFLLIPVLFWRDEVVAQLLLPLGRVHAFSGDHVDDPLADVARVICYPLQVPGNQYVIDAGGDFFESSIMYVRISRKIVSYRQSTSSSRSNSSRAMTESRLVKLSMES